MKRAIALLSIVLAGGLAHAAPASEESIERLLVLMRAESTVEGIFQNFEPMVRQTSGQATAGLSLTPAQRQVLDELPARIGALMRQQYGCASMKADHVRIYRETFEQEELDGLISFYSSPAGQAYVNKMPLLTQKAMVLVQRQIGTMVPRVAEEVARAMKEAGIGRP